jgi:hypothetical protein
VEKNSNLILYVLTRNLFIKINQINLMENISNMYSDLKVNQFGYVFRDVEAQAKKMEKFFGIPKFNIFEPLELDTVYRGKATKYTVKSAFARLFDNTELELIQIVKGTSIHTEFLDQGREGLHHVSFNVNNLSTVIDDFASKGIEVIQSGKIIGLKYAYMDTESLLGIILEFSETKRKRRN